MDAFQTVKWKVGTMAGFASRDCYPVKRAARHPGKIARAVLGAEATPPSCHRDSILMPRRMPPRGIGWMANTDDLP
jgi:hypothetical protein